VRLALLAGVLVATACGTPRPPLLVLTGKVDGSFAGGGDVRGIDVYCGWSGSSVIVHVRLWNVSGRRVVVRWRPSYELANAPGGTASLQETVLLRGEKADLFVSHRRAKVERLTGCRPQLVSVSAPPR
jgi:hypothetical protein